MPIYEFACMECEERFEELLRPSDADPTCPACGGTRVRRRLSIFAARSTYDHSDVGRPGGCACGGACACGH